MWLLLIVVIAVAPGLGLWPPHVPAVGAAPSVNREEQIKAAFVYNFTKFVTWPAECFPAPDSPLVVGVWGGDSFSSELETIVRDRAIDGRAFEVRTIGTVEEARQVHVLFVGEWGDADLPALLTRLTGARVLTVGESERFAELGGMITFRVEGERVRFSINMDSADHAGLHVSARLQKLATVVRRH